MAKLSEDQEEELRELMWQYAMAYYTVHVEFLSNKDVTNILRKEVDKSNEIIAFVKEL